MARRRYGGFWRRSIAFVIDEVILYFVSLILFLIALLALGLKGEMMGRVLASDEMRHGMGLFGLLYLASSLLAGMTYFTWFHGVGGRTPGKMLLGLRVVQASGDPMTPGIAFLRWVGYMISGIVFCLGFLWIAFDRRKQGWHDKIAATVVIRERREPDAVEIGEAFLPPAPAAAPPQAVDPAAPAGEPGSPFPGDAGSRPSDGEPGTAAPPSEQPQEKPGAGGSLPVP